VFWLRSHFFDGVNLHYDGCLSDLFEKCKEEDMLSDGSCEGCEESANGTLSAIRELLGFGEMEKDMKKMNEYTDSLIEKNEVLRDENEKMRKKVDKLLKAISELRI
jgi:hypothetical protein